MINIDRLLLTIDELARIGHTADGVTRLSYTKEEWQANEYVKQLMEESGLTTYYDAIGNLIGEWKTSNDLPAIVLGSHIDTVPNGGKFDGALGVLAAIEAVRTLREQNVALAHPIKIIAFKDEEGTRFQYGMIGSRAAAGTLTEDALEKTDTNGVSIKEAMIAQGYNPNHLATCQLTNVKCYLELHIEQGKVLEQFNTSVGVVTGIAGPLWKQYTIKGLAEHAGATPMSLRKDALAASAEMLLHIEKIAHQFDEAVATVGQLQVAPSGINVIPGEVKFSLDIRHTEEVIRNELEAAIEKSIAAIAERRDVIYEVEQLQRVAPVKCDFNLQTHIQNAMRLNHLPIISLPSGAGHDAMQFNGLFPVAMLFVRSKDGISHNPLEYTAPNDIKDATNVLLETIKRIDLD